MVIQSMFGRSCGNLEFLRFDLSGFGLSGQGDEFQHLTLLRDPFISQNQRGQQCHEPFEEGEDHERHGKTWREQRFKEQRAQAEAGEKEEGVEAHRLSAAAGVQGRDDACERWMAHVVPEREGGGDQRGGGEREARRKGRAGQGGEQQACGDNDVAPEAVGSPSDQRPQEHAGDAIAEQRHADPAIAQPVSAGEVKPQPGKDAGVEQCVEEDEQVAAPAARVL
jgi:hypothetical protein